MCHVFWLSLVRENMADPCSPTRNHKDTQGVLLYTSAHLLRHPQEVTTLLSYRRTLHPDPFLLFLAFYQKCPGE